MLTFIILLLLDEMQMLDNGMGMEEIDNLPMCMKNFLYIFLAIKFRN